MRALASAAARRAAASEPLIAPTFTFVSKSDCLGVRAVYGVKSGFASGPMKLARISVATRSKMLNAGSPSINSMVFTMLG